MDDAPLYRFEEYGRLTTREREAVINLAGPPRTVRRGAYIQRAGMPSRNFYLLVQGWSAALHDKPTGGQQILKVHLPGDALGTSSMAMARTTEELVAITDAVVVEVELTRFGSLFEGHPRLAARFMLSIQQERISLMDRLAAMGRKPADARVAAFLLDLHDRLKPLGLVQQDGFDLHLTQTQIGDVLGLTSVHVNRMLGLLSRDGLITRERKRVRLVDMERVTVLAARPIRERNINQDWLPRPR